MGTSTEMSCLSGESGGFQIKLPTPSLPLYPPPRVAAPANSSWHPGCVLQGLSWACLDITHPYMPRVCDIKAGREGQEMEVLQLIWPRYLLLAGPGGCWAAETSTSNGLGIAPHLLGHRGPPPTGCVSSSENTTCGPAAPCSASGKGKGSDGNAFTASSERLGGSLTLLMQQMFVRRQRMEARMLHSRESTAKWTQILPVPGPQSSGSWK